MKLIVGVDPADADLTPLRWAHVLARRLGAAVDVIHVVQHEPPAEVVEALVRRDVPELRPEMAEELRGRLAALLQREGAWAAELPVSVEAGWAHRELAARAREVGEGVVVVGPGRRRWLRGLLGTTTDRLLRTSEVPILVVRGPVAERLQRMLVPVDFSPVSRRAAAVAVRWASALGAEMVLFHVPQVEWSPAGEPAEIERRRPLAVESERATVQRAKVGLTELVADLETGDLRVSREFGRYGAAPADAIVARLAEEDIDLVVMGTHGRSGLDRAILGSVAESVVHRAHLPVLVVPGRS